MVPIRGAWTPFHDVNDQIEHYRSWGLIPPKSSTLRPVMVVDGYFGAPEPCKVVGYQDYNYAVIELPDGYHAIHGEYLAELQPYAYQKLPRGLSFAEVLSKYVVLDIETTGFNRTDDRIIEVAAATYEYGNKIAEYHSLVNPEIIIPSDIVALTGISQDDVAEAPKIGDIKEAFFQFIGDMPIIGHNAVTFDIPFLEEQFSAPIQNPIIDTLPMAREVFNLLPRHKLDYLNHVLQLDSAGTHRANNDVETTNALLWACLAPRKYEQLIFKEFLDQKIGHAYTKPKNRNCKPLWNGKQDSKPKAPKFQKIDISAITPSCDCIDSSSLLCGKDIVFTGELSIPRDEAMQLAVNAGAILKSSVSRKTAYLVVGKQDTALVGADGMSTKEEKAHALNDAGKANIQIITEEQFLALVKKEGSLV